MTTEPEAGMPTDASADAPAVVSTAAPDAPDVRVSDDGDASLLALIDRLANVLERSELSELEVEAGGTALVLRKPVAIAAPTIAAPATAPAEASEASTEATASSRDRAPSRPSIKAPLTGIFYASPSPNSPPFVSVGGEVAVGQVIGLIEAMKLFNEIKSDVAGRVARVVAESGQLVKAKQPLVEVDPL
jgi:acetyl-CoA carboxylase biotin carboxyl carrier protein